MNNTIMTIFPYKDRGLWVFDDEATGLVKEPFVGGTDIIFDKIAEMHGGVDSFTVLFSNEAFPGHNITFERRQPEGGGYWYHVPELKMDGWICSALFLYFKEAPDTIYAEFKSNNKDN